VKIQGPEVDWRSTPLDVDAMYYVGGCLPYGRYAKVEIVFS
jgi:hypothetical protein